MKKVLLQVLAALLVFMQGCTSASVEEDLSLMDNFTEKVELGMTRTEVIKLIGEPDAQVASEGIRERYECPNGWAMDFIYSLDDERLTDKRLISPEGEEKPGSSFELWSLPEDAGYSLRDLSRINFQMTYDEIVEGFGRPTFTIGSGITHDYYQLKGGGYLEFYFGGTENRLAAVVLEALGQTFEMEESEGFRPESATPGPEEPRDKYYTLSDFFGIELGMSYKEAVQLAGEADALIAPDRAWVYYPLDEGWLLGLLFEEKALTDIRILGPGKAFTLTSE